MPPSRELRWQEGKVTVADRERLLGHKGCILWFTGLSGSGKSTLARALETQLVAAGHLAYVFDGDNVRHGLNADLGFSPEDRHENIRRVGEVAALFADAGVIAITALISPYCSDRDRVREIVPVGQFLEIFLDVPVDVCEDRDPKNLYKKARQGLIPEFTGVSAPYEVPPHPDITLRTHEVGIEEAICRIWAELERREIIPRRRKRRRISTSSRRRASISSGK
jgi:adenylylsulfate kinase